MRTKDLTFLGHHLRRMPVRRKGGTEARILRCVPSKKAMEKWRLKVKDTAPRYLLLKKINDLIKILNPKIMGWRNHFGKVDSGAANSFLAQIV